MAFTIKPTREKTQWIKRNAEKDARKAMDVALDRWITDGGFSAEETKAQRKKIVFVARKSE